MSLQLVTWVNPREHHELLEDGSTCDAEPDGETVGRFCAVHGIPHAVPATTLRAFVGPIPSRILREHRGLVRVVMDVDWIAEELRVAIDGDFRQEAVEADRLQRSGRDVSRRVRRFQPLSGSPASRAAIVSEMARRSDGRVQVRVLRPVTDDDVEEYVVEGPALPIL